MRSRPSIVFIASRSTSTMRPLIRRLFGLLLLTAGLSAPSQPAPTASDAATSAAAVGDPVRGQRSETVGIP